MAWRRRDRSRLLDAGLDMTPMIDVVFLLVIFLLISTTFKKKQLSLELNLPRAGQSEFRTPGKEHQVRIDSAGKMFLCANESTDEGTDALNCKSGLDSPKLLKEFTTLAEKYPGVRLGVYAAADVSYEQIIKVVAAATEAGLDLNLPYDTEEE